EHIRIAAAAGALCLLFVACSPASRDEESAPRRPEANAAKPDESDSLVAYDKEPELVSMAQPEYPDAAREQHIQGVVLVRVLVGTDGLVKHALVIRSVPMLDPGALRAAQSAVFRPGTLKGRPVEVWMVVPIEYSLGK